MICEQCGRELTVGEWPFCPHGMAHATAVIGDEFPGGGGRWFEHLDHQPVYCRDKADLRREMDKRNLRHTDRHVPGDTQLSNWGAAIDAYTLENAKILLSRGKMTRTESVVCETLQMTQRLVTLNEP